MDWVRIGAIPCAVFWLAGCGSIAKGITEAVLEQKEEVDSRACYVEGPASTGLEATLVSQELAEATGNSSRQTKLLMVHGIGRHTPGYSARLTENLMQALGLDVRAERSKDIVLRQPEIADGPLGNLRISQFNNKDRTRELLFYELTWSEITDPEKEAIAFDNSGEYTFRRTFLNNAMKEFFNSHIPDPLIYVGRLQPSILASVQQSFCWMTWGDWGDYEEDMEGTCDLFAPQRAGHLQDDHYAFVTHSLGSRIVIDTIQSIGGAQLLVQDPRLAQFLAISRGKHLPVYMLANQLPLLELGREPAPVRGQIADYCSVNGSLAEERIVGAVTIYAFSDPNDILSYAIPPKFADQYLDSRICPRVTNIILNVAKPISVFGLGEVANPAEAHVGYDNDERVIALIAHGIGHEGQAPIISEKCTWLETTAD